MLDNHVQFRSIFRKLEGQVEMGSLQLRYCTTTIETLLKIEKELVRTSGLSVTWRLPA